MQVTSHLFLKYIKGYKFQWKNFDETNFGETNFGEKIFGEDLRDLWESFAKKKTTENLGHWCDLLILLISVRNNVE